MSDDEDRSGLSYAELELVDISGVELAPFRVGIAAAVASTEAKFQVQYGRYSDGMHIMRVYNKGYERFITEDFVPFVSLFNPVPPEDDKFFNHFPPSSFTDTYQFGKKLEDGSRHAKIDYASLFVLAELGANVPIRPVIGTTTGSSGTEYQHVVAFDVMFGDEDESAQQLVVDVFARVNEVLLSMSSVNEHPEALNALLKMERDKHSAEYHANKSAHKQRKKLKHKKQVKNKNKKGGKKKRL